MLDNVINMPPSGEGPFDKFNTPNSRILFPVGERNVAWEGRNGAYNKTASHKAIIRINQRGDGGQLLNIVGTNYKLVHNRELFSTVEGAMVDEMPPESLEGVRVTDKVSGWGKVCYRDYVFPAIRCRLSGTKSDIAFRLIVQNGYGGSALRIHAGAIDFYCTNGMVRGEYAATYRKHTSRLVVGNLSATIKEAQEQFVKSQEEWNRWAKTPVKHEKAMALFREIATSTKMKDNLLDQYAREKDDRGDNLWAVYSTLTYYASHADGAFALRSSVEEADNVASTMLTRELNVAKWTQISEWKELEHAN